MRSSSAQALYKPSFIAVFMPPVSESLLQKPAWYSDANFTTSAVCKDIELREKQEQLEFLGKIRERLLYQQPVSLDDNVLSKIRFYR